MIDNQTHQTVEQGEVNLFKHFLEARLQHYHTFALVRVPNIRQVVDALAPLVHQERRRLGV